MWLIRFLSMTVIYHNGGDDFIKLNSYLWINSDIECCCFIKRQEVQLLQRTLQIYWFFITINLGARLLLFISLNFRDATPKLTSFENIFTTLPFPILDQPLKKNMSSKHKKLCVQQLLSFSTKTNLISIISYKNAMLLLIHK